MKVESRFLLIVAVLAVLLSACGTQPEASGDPDADPEPASTATDEVAGGDEEPADEGDSETEGEPTADAEPEGELERVRIQFDWFADSQYTPTLLALERGYFADEGLEPIISEGGGAVSAAHVLGFGGAEVVIGTLDEVPLAVAEGMELTAVAIIEPVTSSAVITLADSDIQEPADLEGTTVAALPGAASGVLFEPFLQAVGVDVDSVERVNVQFPSQVPMLLEGQVDAITGFTRAQGALAQVRGADVRSFLYSDHGIDFVSTGIYTRNDVIENRPDLVEGVVRAVLRGVEDFLEDPAAGVEVGARDYPEHYEDMDYAMAHAELFAEFVEEQMPPEGLGYQDPELWEHTVSLLEEHFGVEDPLPATEYYTNDFLPEN